MSTVMTRTERRLDRPGRRERRAARRRLRKADALSAQLAELHTIRALLEQAGEIVRRGWIQGAWFAVDIGGRTRAHAWSEPSYRPVGDRTLHDRSRSNGLSTWSGTASGRAPANPSVGVPGPRYG